MLPFGSDGVICNGESVLVNTTGSEVSMQYFLVKDATDTLNVIPISGTGNDINYPVTQGGVYTMASRNRNNFV